MSASSTSSQQPRKKTIRKWELQVVAGKSERGEDSKLGKITDSVLSHILKNITGDEARSKFLQSVAEITENIRLDSDEEQKQPDLHAHQEPRGLVPFGPFYGPGSHSIQQAKKAAWKHILHKSGLEAKRHYKLSVKDVTMEIYDIPDVDKPQPEDFRKMMLRDGCFFLQLALHILGGGDLLGYGEEHLYFGKNKDYASWVPDMFFVGNQIPYEVIRVLMEQTFFRDVINEGIQNRSWYCPDEENIAKMALYLTVVKPAFWSRLQQDPHPRPPQLSDPPYNILHCLHSLFLGNRAQKLNDPENRDSRRLEAGSNDDKIEFPSAGELFKLGIKLETYTRLKLSKLGVKVATKGIKNICFRNLGYRAKIYLPTLTIQSHTKDILMNLIRYEQNMNEGDREVTAYVRFMRDLVRTHDDFEILEKKRIIQVKDPKLEGTIIHMLEDLATLHNSNFTLTFRHIRQSITNYGGPPLRFFSYIIGIFTFVATISTILAYVRPPKS